MKDSSSVPDYPGVVLIENKYPVVVFPIRKDLPLGFSPTVEFFYNICVGSVILTPH
jgi:hypothetical protein